MKPIRFVVSGVFDTYFRRKVLPVLANSTKRNDLKLHDIYVAGVENKALNGWHRVLLIPDDEDTPAVLKLLLMYVMQYKQQCTDQLDTHPPARTTREALRWGVRSATSMQSRLNTLVRMHVDHIASRKR